MIRRALGFLLGFSLALAQGLELGVWGGEGRAAFYLRLAGLSSWEGGRVAFSLVPYLGLPGGEGGVSLERLSLTLWEGPWGLELGRFPLSLGQGRLYPYTWNRPSPAGGEEGVWGGALSWYGEGVVARAGWVRERGGFAEVRGQGVRAYLFRGGAGVAAEGRLGEALFYGEGRWEGGFSGLLGASWAAGGLLFTLEGVYPWGFGLGVEGALEALGFSGRVLYREGMGFGLAFGLGGEGWRFLWGRMGGVGFWGAALWGEL
ncbi:hypothetical protein SAMN04488243_11213 [Thermus arciformis]|uniref:Uncharacterized protein n=1 Tax=Thermus arciformis TaxID=482827 RepID=A0A1G7G3A0_9DEIN|nr:hypothetical protein [Thermus arciformis]SDE82570.1 hypothetical protein SAMN04488243_11213 [Thermus arciformis]